MEKKEKGYINYGPFGVRKKTDKNFPQNIISGCFQL